MPATRPSRPTPWGRRRTARYRGQLQTVLDRRPEGQPILRSDAGSAFVKQDEKGDRLLRTEPGLNNTYDLGKLRAPGLVERLGTSRRDPLTPRGWKLGGLLVTRRPRLLGPRASLAVDAIPRRPSHHPSEVEAAFRRVEAALDHLCATLPLTPAA